MASDQDQPCPEGVPGASPAEGDHTVDPYHDFARETSEFIAVAAHKIHTPVTSIKWQTEMLLSEAEGSLTEDQRAALQSIMDAAESLNELSRALLYVFELEKDMPVMQPQDADLRAVLARVIKQVRPLQEKFGVFVAFSPPEEPLTVYVDPELSFVILHTLLSNAIHYSPSGSEVSVCVKQEEEETLVSVRDQGCGISLNQQRLVFTKFFRAQKAKRLWTEGVGLNLYIAHSIVQRTGGSLTFESTEDKGSTFFWHIPRHCCARQPWERRGEEKGISKEGEKQKKKFWLF